MGKRVDLKNLSGKSCYDLGMAYEQEGDFENAIRCYIAAFETGYIPADQKLWHQKCQTKNVETQSHFKIDYDNDDPKELTSLAYKYLTGIGRPQNDSLAFLLFSKVKEKDKNSYNLALFSLALMYAFKRGCSANNFYSGEDFLDQTAANLINKAAEQEYAPAQYYLGTMYEVGQKVAINEQQAISLYIKAAEKGFLPAQDKLDEKYENYDIVDLNAFVEILIPLANTAPNQCYRLLQKIHDSETQRNSINNFFKNPPKRLSKNNFGKICYTLATHIYENLPSDPQTRQTKLDEAIRLCQQVSKESVVYEDTQRKLEALRIIESPKNRDYFTFTSRPR